jgi:hypothetical protein
MTASQSELLSDAFEALVRDSRSYKVRQSLKTLRRAIEVVPQEGVDDPRSEASDD